MQSCAKSARKTKQPQRIPPKDRINNKRSTVLIGSPMKNIHNINLSIQFYQGQLMCSRAPKRKKNRLNQCVFTVFGQNVDSKLTLCYKLLDLFLGIATSANELLFSIRATCFLPLHHQVQDPPCILVRHNVGYVLF